MVNVAIVGYGKMGKLIEQLSKDNGLEVVSIIDPNEEKAQFKEINKESMHDVDVCIDFTHPDEALKNTEKAASLGKNIVMATTGWYEDMEKMKEIVENSKVGMIWSGNFSVGVNMFFRMVRAAAKIVDKIDNYDVFSYEMHHNKKADSPSGTAEMLGKILLDESKTKSKLVYDKLDRKIKPEELHLASVRGGSIPGTHVVGFDSTADTIELKHTARNREGFAMGAILAAKWIKDKKGFFCIDDMMKSIIG